MVYDVRRGRWPLVDGDSESISAALVPFDAEEVEPRISLNDLESYGDSSLPSTDALELAESILQRLKPADRNEMGQMVFRNSVASGILLMAVALFWWLTVTKFADELGSDKAPDSLIMGWNYVVVGAVVPLLVFFSTVLMKLSREKSEPRSGFIAGAMLILAVFMAIEPLGHLAFGGAPMQMMLHSSRLLALGVMVYYCASMFLDALLISWVRNLLGAFPIDISPLGGAPAEGQAEEAPPLA
ncbi:MAG: hypothetical protein QGF94_02885 [Candidatus Thalassarchaeaceae archaeon]|jgi:hypothetical protein|nr:hypothetical protein [Candidatus Thalassarchaeaceae archaeon]